MGVGGIFEVHLFGASSEGIVQGPALGKEVNPSLYLALYLLTCTCLASVDLTGSPV